MQGWMNDMFYAIANSINSRGTVVYDILGEFTTIKEAYDFLSENGYKKKKSYKYKASNKFYNEDNESVEIWKENYLDDIVEEMLYRNPHDVDIYSINQKAIKYL